MRKFFSFFIDFIFTVCVIIAFALSVGMRNDENRNEQTDNLNMAAAEDVVSNANTTGVYACGRLTGIYEQTDGVLVVDVVPIKGADGKEYSPAKKKIQSGDYILSANGKKVTSKEEFAKIINDDEKDFLEIRYLRNDKEHVVSLNPVIAEDGKEYLGLWIKDDLAGIGTITYYTENGKLGALGHGIGDGTKNGELLNVCSGDLYKMDLSNIKKGKSGSPGELGGVVYFGKKSHIGTLDGNNDNGIFGKLDSEEIDEYIKDDDYYEIASENDIKAGKAQIISYISGEKRKYDIKILEVDHECKDSNKKLVIEVTDDELIELTGGIIQGMSGSPIIQNGKIVGAVTHVLVNDPTRGYGIFIENMLER